MDPGAQSVTWRLGVAALGATFSMLASFLESTCWQEIASQITRLCHPRFKSSRKRHPASQGLQPSPGIGSNGIQLGLMVNRRDPENAGRRLASLSHVLHLDSVEERWFVL